MSRFCRLVEVTNTGNGLQFASWHGLMKWFATAALAVFAISFNAPSSVAQQVQSVKICDQYGAGFFYIPGTDQCAFSKNLPYRYQTTYGTYATQAAAQAAAYGTNAFANGTGSVAVGD